MEDRTGRYGWASEFSEFQRTPATVLLTRGRDGTVVFVPPLPLLDETYEHLVGSGFRQIEAVG